MKVGNFIKNKQAMGKFLRDKFNESYRRTNRVELAKVDKNTICPGCGSIGYKTDVAKNSYACKKCLSWWKY